MSIPIFTVDDIIQKLDCWTMYALIWERDKEEGTPDDAERDWGNVENLLS